MRIQPAPWLALGTALAVSLASCAKKTPTPSTGPVASDTAHAALFPPHAPPPLKELVEQANAQQPPKGDGAPYVEPARVEVPELEQPTLDELPKSPEGYPLLQREKITGLALDPTLSDPITALGTCLSLVLGCFQPPDTPNGRSIDACVVSAQACKTEQPWAETEPCCPASCQDLYRELRGRGYTDADAWILVGSGNCMPGLKEFMEQAK